MGEVECEVEDMMVGVRFDYGGNEGLMIEEHEHEVERVGVFLEGLGRKR